MIWRILLVTAAGCGRLAFDAPASDAAADARVCAAPVGHDEDGDGVDDACDGCPHLVDDQRDRDGDGVGDACDPEPTVGRQSIAMFDPLIAPNARWTLDNATIDATGLHMTGTTGYANAQMTLGTTSDVMIVGVRASGAPASSYHVQISAGLDSTQYFYCERYANAVSELIQLTYTLDGNNYLHDGSDSFGSALINGSGTIALAINGDGVGCAVAWNGQSLSVGGSRHAIPVSFIGISANDCDAVIDYALLIHTN